MTLLLGLLIFIFILSVLVLIHEFGHFIAAKRNGIMVEEFGLGFPPRLFGIKKGETLYSINALPLGGFVKVFGEEYHEGDKINPKLKNRAFINKKPWQKAMVVVAGVFMNILLGSAIFYGLLAANHFQSDQLPIYNNYHFRFGHQISTVAVAGIVDNSPAAKAGVQPEESVVSYVDPTGTTVDVHSAKQLIDAIKASANKPLTLNLENLKNGQKRAVSITPEYDSKLKRAIIGAQLADTAIISYDTPVQKVLSGFMHSYNMAAYNLKTLAFLFQSSVQEKNLEPVSQSVSGPIGIFVFVNDVVSTSGGKFIVNILNIMAMMSLSLATINILPFPALDGGRLVFIVYEWITGKKNHAKIEQKVNMIGFMFLIGLMVLISVNDVAKLVVRFFTHQ